MEKSKIIKIAKNPSLYELENRQRIPIKMVEELGWWIWDLIEYEVEELSYGTKRVTKIVNIEKEKSEYEKYFEDFEKVKDDKDTKKKYFDEEIIKIAKKFTDLGLSATKLRKYYQEYKKFIEDNTDIVEFYRLKALINYDAWRWSKKDKQALSEFKKYVEALISTTEKYFDNKDLLEYLKKHFEALIAYVAFYKK